MGGPCGPPAHTPRARAGRCEESATPEEVARGGDSREGKLRSVQGSERAIFAFLGVGLIEARNSK